MTFALTESLREMIGYIAQFLHLTDEEMES